MSLDFWSRTERLTDSCWEWKSSLDSKGYGRYLPSGSWKTIAAHRYAYISIHGQVADEIEIHHRCKNKKCINPDHLEALTALEHSHLNPNYLKEFCPRGHALTEDNLDPWNLARGIRRCWICHRASKKVSPEFARERNKAWRLANLEKYREYHREYNRRYRESLRMSRK